MKTKKINGLVAAAFTPMKRSGSVNAEQIPVIVNFLISQGVKGIYVCGSTGEGPSLTSLERREVAEAFVKAAAKRVHIFVHVGHNSVKEAKELAAHAEQIGADFISAVAPSYYKVGSVRELVSCLSEVASGAPDLPFYYYHIPRLTNISIDMREFLRMSELAIPSLAGVKFTSSELFEYQECLNYNNRRYDLLYGTDEMLLGALAVGAEGFIGSTYNFMAPLYKTLIENFKKGNLKKAQELQLKSVEIVRIIVKYGGLAAQKEMMKIAGVDCGDVRNPLMSLTGNDKKLLRKDLMNAGFLK